MEKTDKVLINCGVPQKFILDHCCPYSILWNDTMVQAVNCDFLLYGDAMGLIFQQKDNNIIEHQLNRYFSNTCGWFVDNKSSIHFGVKTKQDSFFLFLWINTKNCTN